MSDIVDELLRRAREPAGSAAYSDLQALFVWAADEIASLRRSLEAESGSCAVCGMPTWKPRRGCSGGHPAEETEKRT